MTRPVLGILALLLAAGCGDGDGGQSGSFAWIKGAPCPLARFEASGVVVNGELWVMGGFSSSSLTVTRRIDVYDPEADTWRRELDLPGAETHMAVAKISDETSDEIIVAGGFPGAFAPRPPPTTAVWRYDLSTSEWTVGPPLPQGGAAFAFAAIGTELHLAGGLASDGDSDAEVHHVWDVAGAAGWTAAAPFPRPRNHGGGTATGGAFYAIAGRHHWDEVAGDVADVDAFDPTTGAWTARAPIPSARSEIGGSTSTLSDGRVLVIGGSLPGIAPSSEVFIYDPASDSWSRLRSLPERRKGAVAFQLGRRIIVTTGSPTSTDPSATTFIGCCL